MNINSPPKRVDDSRCIRGPPIKLGKSYLGGLGTAGLSEALGLKALLFNLTQ